MRISKTPVIGQSIPKLIPGSISKPSTICTNLTIQPSDPPRERVNLSVQERLMQGFRRFNGNATDGGGERLQDKEGEVKAEDRRPCAEGPYGLSILPRSTSICAAPFPFLDEPHGFERLRSCPTPGRILLQCLKATASFDQTARRLGLNRASYSAESGINPAQRLGFGRRMLERSCGTLQWA
jgi:hypothetical protein